MLLEDHVKQVRAIATGNFQHITEAFCGNQCGFGAFALGEGIDDGGGAVEKGFDALVVDATFLQYIHDPLLEIRGCGVGFFQQNLALLVNGHQVGEGAANVCCNSHVYTSLFKILVHKANRGDVPPKQMWANCSLRQRFPR